jgi:hypothetical protein
MTIHVRAGNPRQIPVGQALSVVIKKKARAQKLGDYVLD